MADDSATFKVGDKVTLVKRTHRRYEPEAEIQTTVTKVGRKYFWVEHGLHYQKFHLGSGLEVSNYTASCYVTTPERQAAKKRHAAAIEKLRELGVRFDWQSRTLSAATLEAIIAAVQAEVDA